LGLVYTLLALGGEAGEAQNVMKKIMRDENFTLSETRRVELLLELGDVLWYLSAAAHELGSSLDDLAQRNIEKLTARRTIS
jgi:NTP pyrophosphatase (non-canonical NTP hydrolase)